MSVAALRSPPYNRCPATSPLLHVNPASQPLSTSSLLGSNGAIDNDPCKQTRCSKSVARHLVLSFKSISTVGWINKTYGQRTKGRLSRRKYEICAAANGESDDVTAGEGPTQDIVERSRRLLALQKELLDQIAERKRLVTALKENLGILPEQRKAYNYADDSKKGEAGWSHSDTFLGPESQSKPFSSNAAITRGSGVPLGAASQSDISAKPAISQSSETAAKYAYSRTHVNDLFPLPLPSTSNVSSLAPETLRPKTGAKAWHENVVEVKAHTSKEPLEKLEIAAAAGTIGEKPQPLAGTNVINVIVVAAECAPWSKTGGLGDVAGALPKALSRRGHRVMVVAPRYAQYADAWETGVRKSYNVAGQDMEVGFFHGYIDGVDYVFVDNPLFHGFAGNIYGGSREDVLKRMVLLCKAAIEVQWHVPCGGVCYGDDNLVFVANDWHTALLPVYLQAYYRDNGLMYFVRSIIVIHNMAHQGRGPLSDFALLGLPDHYMDTFRLYDQIGGEHMNIFKAGLMAAHRIVAVSHGYAWECQTQEGGWGLDGVIREHSWKLRGIVNGIDDKEWSPELDVHLKSDGYTNYSLDTLESGKATCKAALQKELGLPVRHDVPILGFIGRLDQQKGVDIISDAMHWLMAQDVQLLMLGSGRADLEDMLRSFESQHHSKVRGWVGFSIRTAHRITAGSDILLMPSRFEPCGLNQLYAMRYGTVPVVHAVGGLRDTVQAFDPFSNTGTGWTFDKADASAMIHALGNAMWTYWDFKDSWRGIQKRGMSQDLSWDNAARQYEEVLLEAKYQW